MDSNNFMKKYTVVGTISKDGDPESFVEIVTAPSPRAAGLLVAQRFDGLGLSEEHDVGEIIAVFEGEHKTRTKKFEFQPSEKGEGNLRK